ncbi:MAG: serine/threonine protein kinase, partial [Actinomycetota bacterium]|nr:serine/threonine protein kinase [Actinomycetota bacterium]
MAEAALALSPSELVAERYRPLRPLGSGGSGSVWLARDERTGLEVALKIVPREGKAATRAEREALAATRLRHERCLRAYGLERDTRNVYIAYEYVPGQTLRQALRAGELNDADAVEAGAQILEALAHAHGRGIVHRDVKPSNVLVAEGEELSIRLLDFGLAQLAEEESLTATGDVPGTLAYVPPERLRGESGGPPADIWAVGVLLWESLAGWHPFWNGSLLETAKRIEGGAAPLAQVRPDLPKPLTALIDRMLSVDPAARPAAARLAFDVRDAFAERLRRRKTRTTVP